MLVATPDHAGKWRATIETSLGRGFDMPEEAPFIDHAALEERAESWPL